MLEDGLGPVFKSSFTGHTRSEYGKNFTFIYAKKMRVSKRQIQHLLSLSRTNQNSQKPHAKAENLF